MPLHLHAQGANPSADNTEMNEGQRGLTPLDQSNTQMDTQIVAAIRSALTDDSSLSVNAQNVKVVVRGGAVTLRGPVANASEKARVEAIAGKVQGVTAVHSDIQFKQ